MPDQPYSHCSYCGTPFPAVTVREAIWPRTCTHCGRTSFRNPIPVCVVIVPVQSAGQTGILVVRRSIPPRIGQLALPGGYINYGETWQEAGARELLEESGLEIDPGELREFHVRSAPDGTLIIFALANPRPAADLPVFTPNEEASERLVLSSPVPMAFELHTQMVEQALALYRLRLS
jgi:8-oxo-dGTP diphosphatase